jgi:hypothetical protein
MNHPGSSATPSRSMNEAQGPHAVAAELAGYLGGEPGHDMERRLDELHCRL